MANMSVLELEGELRYMIGGDADEDSTRLRRWLKQGYEFVTLPNIYQHPELEHMEVVALVAGAAQTTTAVWNKVEVVRYYDDLLASVTANTEGHRLRPTSYRLLLDRSRLQEGIPRRYSFRTNQFLLDTMIDTVHVGYGLLVAGYRKPADVTWADDNDTTDIREEWDQLVILAAAMYGFTWKGLYEKAQGARDALGRLVNDMPPIQAMSAEDWEDEMRVTGGVSDYRNVGGMRRGRGRY